MNTQHETITVSADTWRWAQEAAQMLAALRICGADRLPIWIEAQRMCSGDQAQAQPAGLVVRRGAYGQ